MKAFKTTKKLSRQVLILCGVMLSLSFVFPQLSIASGEKADLLEPQVDFEMVVLLNNQTATVTANFATEADLKIVPVVCLGSGPLSISMTKTDTKGEVLAISQFGSGDPNSSYNVGLTPITISLPGVQINELGVVVVISGGIFTAEQDAHRYSINLRF